MKSPLFSYVALIRGIMPMNPNTKNKKLREVFERLKFTDVETVISSGNVVFRTKQKDTALLEQKIEKAMHEHLKFKTPVIVRSQKELETMIQKDPFKSKTHSRASYLIVTFMKGKSQEVFTTLDLAKEGNPSFMTKLEKKHGKVITTRTWKTVEKIMKKFV